MYILHDFNIFSYYHVLVCLIPLSPFNILFPLVCVWQPLLTYSLLNFLLHNFLLPYRSLDMLSWFFVFMSTIFPMLCILHLCVLFVFICSVCILCSGSHLEVMVFCYLLGHLYADRPFNKEAFMSKMRSLWIVAATALIQLEMDEEIHSVDSFLQGVVTDSKVMMIWTRCCY